MQVLTENINCRHIQLTVNLQSFDYMPQSENNANDVPFLQEDKNSIMGKQWTFYPPNRGIGTLDYPPNLKKIQIFCFEKMIMK